MRFNHIAIIGGSGTIGKAITKQLAKSQPHGKIYTFSRNPPEVISESITPYAINYEDEQSIKDAALIASKEAQLDLVMVTTGILHDSEVMPEKSLQELSSEKFQKLFSINTILPALVAKHFVPKLNKKNNSVFAAISARLGSISDNYLGGWYAYRASKAALNMIIRNAAIETGRKNKQATIVGIHPGTVDSPLSKPFQQNIAKKSLFTADDSAEKILAVLHNLAPKDSGKCFAWDGKEIKP